MSDYELFLYYCLLTATVFLAISLMAAGALWVIDKIWSAQ